MQNPDPQGPVPDFGTYCFLNNPTEIRYRTPPGNPVFVNTRPPFSGGPCAHRVGQPGPVECQLICVGKHGPGLLRKTSNIKYHKSKITISPLSVGRAYNIEYKSPCHYESYQMDARLASTKITHGKSSELFSGDRDMHGHLEISGPNHPKGGVQYRNQGPSKRLEASSQIDGFRWNPKWVPLGTHQLQYPQKCNRVVEFLSTHWNPKWAPGARN